MIRLLSIEFQKIWMNRWSRFLILSYFFILSLIALLASVEFKIGNFELHFADMGIFNFPYIWHFNSYVADFCNFFLAIVIVSMVASEYTYGTLKQNLIDGLSKKEFLATKLITVAVFSGLTTVFVFVMSLILGYSFSSYTEFSIVFSEMEYLFAFFLKLVGFFTLCLFLGLLVKRSAFALGLLLLMYIFEGILHGICGIYFGKEMMHNIMQFFPMTSLSNLLVEPFSKLAVIKSIGSQIGVKDMGQSAVRWSAILISIAWTVIFVLTSYKLLKKRDL